MQGRPLVVIIARPYDGEVLRRAVAEAGFEAVAVDGRARPCERVEELRPAVVVLSLRRMQGDGATILTELRQGKHGGVPVVVVGEPGSATPEGVDLVLRSAEPGALAAAVGSLIDGLAVDELTPAHLEGAVPEEGAVLEAAPFDGAEAEAGVVPAAVERVAPVEALEPPVEAPQAAADAMPPPRAVSEPPVTEDEDEVLAPPASITLPRSGDVRLMDVPHLLQQAHLEGFTGRLTLRREDATKTIYFDGGDPVFAQSSQPHDRLGDLLHREGKISWEQYLECQEQVAQTGRRVGAVLVDMGLIKPRELFPLVRRHVTEITYSLFSWSDGVYELVHGEPVPEEKIKLDVHPAAVLMEGIRRKYGLDRLLELVGPPETRLTAHGAGLARLARADLLEAERHVVELMDGERTLQQIIEVSSLRELGVYQVAYATIVLGAAIVRGVGEMMVYGSETVTTAQRRELAIDRQRVEAKHAQVREGDYFSLLGLRVDASGHEVRRAYERTREDFAPTSFAVEVASELAGQLAEIGEVIDEAMRVLGDDELREAYRASIR